MSKIIHTSIFRKPSDLTLLTKHMEDLEATEAGRSVANILCSHMTLKRSQELNAFLAKTGFMYKSQYLWLGTKADPASESYIKDFIVRFGVTPNGTTETKCETAVPV